LNRLSLRAAYQKTPAYRIAVNKKSLKEFTSRLPFPLTGAQERAVNEIMQDLGGDRPMTRLLEGDVGSGKTAVAALAAYMCVMSGKEVAYMAPTEILARQHFESFIKFFDHLNIQVGLLTGKEARKFPSKVYREEHTHISKPTLLKWVATGQIPILVGTHALIQKKVKWQKLGLVIIDEQHRFGVMQRGALTQKGGEQMVPHLFSMTATPIPRTLALTLYGDLDLSVLDELPKGRQGVTTKIIHRKDEAEMYAHIKLELAAGRQAFVICPRIDEADPNKASALQLRSAKQEAKRLAETIFPEYTIGVMHSKLKPKDKEEVMADFEEGKIKILVSTSVVEVGINVPNATVIIIEGAERFGLSQLHQLRGRVMRSSHMAHCYLRTDSTNQKSAERLKALVEAKNGFELAELDLSLRGAGTLTDTNQWGVSDIAMEALKNLRLVEAARAEAKNLLAGDPELLKHPLLQKHLKRADQELHLE
jgi:ATP-dependent DNA helicase RecG